MAFALAGPVLAASVAWSAPAAAGPPGSPAGDSTAFTTSSPAVTGSPGAGSSGKELSLIDILLMAEHYSPRLKAADESVASAKQVLRADESLYYPSLFATAVDSVGYPASGVAPDGFNGQMSSPFRVGITGGVYTTWMLFDLAREYSVRTSKFGIHAARERTRLERLDIDLRAMNLYLDAVLNRRQRDAWEGIQHEIERLYGVVRKFVRSGQYSDVTQWLLKGHLEGALRRKEDFDFAYVTALRRIEIFTGASPGSLSLQGFSSLDPALATLSRNREPQSPIVTAPRLQARVSESAVSVQTAQNWPTLVGIGSAGMMESSRLVPRQDYAGWIGLSFPIFEGFRITADIDRARADAQRSSDLADQALLDLADADERFRQQIHARETDIRHDRAEREFALKGLHLAEHRYVTFVGDLADVRDSLTEYETAESRLNADQVELYRSKLAQTITDGGYPGG